MAWWRQMGHDAPTRAQIAAIAGWRVTSGHLKNKLGELSTAGLVDYPEPGRVRLTAAGVDKAPSPDMSRTMIAGILDVLSGPQAAIFNALLPHRTRAMTRPELAAALGWEPTSGHLKNKLGELSTMQIVTYPAPGHVALADWIFEGETR